MDITPNDMRNHEFGSQMRGYEKAEVKAFVESSANALEQALIEIQKLRMEYDKISAQYRLLKDLEETIKSAVLEAQKNANQIVANAKKEAELLVNKAQQDREQIFEQKRRQMLNTQTQLEKLEYQRESFYNKLRSEIEAHLKLVDSICPPEKGLSAKEVKPEEEAEAEMAAEFKMELSEEQKKEEKAEIPQEPERPQLDMKDDDIDAALESFGEVSSGEKKEPEPSAPVNVDADHEGPAPNEAEQKKSDVKEGVQDGQTQPKGYDF